MLLTEITLLLPRKEIRRDSGLCFQIVQLLKVMPRKMLKLSTVLNLASPHAPKKNLYMMSRDTLLPSSYQLLIDFFFLHIQFRLFQTKNLQSPGTYISGRTWDPSLRAITK